MNCVAALAVPLLLGFWGWRRFWQRPLPHAGSKAAGFALLLLAAPTLLSLAFGRRVFFGEEMELGGVVGRAVSDAARGVDFAEFKAQVRDGDILVPKVPAREPLKEQLRHFVECCLSNRTPETDGIAGRRVVAALEAATRSLRAEGMRVELSSVPLAR